MPVALDFTHFANGAGTTSGLVFVNLSTQPTQPTLYFYDQEGQLMEPESVVDLTEDLEVTEDGALSTWTEMEPLGELTILTHGRGEGVSGSVRVVSDGPIGGFLRFDLPGIGVAGVGASQPVRDALFPARRQADGISTAWQGCRGWLPRARTGRRGPRGLPVLEDTGGSNREQDGPQERHAVACPGAAGGNEGSGTDERRGDQQARSESQPGHLRFLHSSPSIRNADHRQRSSCQTRTRSISRRLATSMSFCRWGRGVAPDSTS